MSVMEIGAGILMVTAIIILWRRVSSLNRELLAVREQLEIQRRRTSEPYILPPIERPVSAVAAQRGRPSLYLIHQRRQP